MNDKQYDIMDTYRVTDKKTGEVIYRTSPLPIDRPSMNDKQKASLKEYLDRIDGHTIDSFMPSIGDRRPEPTFEGWIMAEGFQIYMGIEPDGSRHT